MMKKKQEKMNTVPPVSELHWVSGSRSNHKSVTKKILGLNCWIMLLEHDISLLFKRIFVTFFGDEKFVSGSGSGFNKKA
jgi:hypothetical protein